MSEVPRSTDVTGGRALERTIFYGLVATIFLAAIPYGTVEPWAIAMFECAIFLLALLCIAHSLLVERSSAGNLRLFLPVIALVVWAALQSVSFGQTEIAGSKVRNAISADPFESWAFALRVTALTVAGVLAVWFTRRLVRLSVLVHAIITLAVICGLFGIVRQTTHYRPDLVLPYLSNGRGYAQFINRNHLAFLIEPAIGLLLGITLLRRDRRERLLLYLSAMIILWVAVVMSGSRGGLLALTVEMICAAALFIYFRKHGGGREGPWHTGVRSITLFTASILVLLLVISAGVIWLGGDQLSSGVDTATLELRSAGEAHEGARRVDIWCATWRMARSHPFAGAGLGGYWAEISRYHDASGEQTPQQAHNDYLELLASGGLIGAALFLWFVAELISRMRWAVQNFRGFQRATALGAIVGIIGVGVHSLVDFGLHITINALVFMMLLAILSLDKVDQRARPQEHRTPAFN